LKTGIKWPQSLANQPGNANRKSRNFAKQVSAYGLQSLAAAGQYYHPKGVSTPGFRSDRFFTSNSGYRLLKRALELVHLPPLMACTSGRPEISVGLIDGPVLFTHPELSSQNIREVAGKLKGSCARSNSVACRHGTFVAGMLLAKRGSAAPAICQASTLLVRPIFSETVSGDGHMPSATPQELASAIVETIEAGARILNLSAALTQQSARGEGELQSALDYAAQRAVIVVAAAGNEGVVGSSVITRHPWVIPIASCDLEGRPLSQSNLGSSIGRGGAQDCSPPSQCRFQGGMASVPSQF